MHKEEILKEMDDIKKAMADPHLAEGTASTYDRISGYYRALENWNSSKSQEEKDRNNYNINAA